MSLVDLGKRLLDATKRGDTDEVRQLMSNGAPFTTDWLGTSPLHFAAQFGHVSTAEVLLRAGISRDARTKVDRTPLHVASQEGHIEIVELLLRNGADIEAKDMLKMTPLHWAVEKGHIQIIQALIKQGADVTCDNKFDKTPVEISLTNGRTDIAHMLQMNQTGNIELTTAEPQVIEEVTTTPAIINNSLQHVMVSETPVAIVPNLHTVLTNIGDDGGNNTSVTEVTDQSSTSVLATLAALAEASGPLNASSSTNTTAAEAWNWLETHGITMISTNEPPTMVTSSLESGQTLTLTEAGKLALNLVKHQTLVDEGGETEVVEETVETLENVVTDGEQRVIAIVEDQSQLGDGTATVMVTVAEGDSEEKEGSVADEGSGEPASKKAHSMGNQEDLQRQLLEVQRKADDYKAQLKEKAQEAEVYRKQLNEMTAKTTSP